jgi:2-keto-4-pentenoate hydratase/2-oxohepta-3-ene-1,7-dioic acid hydratase in catechol pathway
MRLVTYRLDNGNRAGFLVGEVVVDAEVAARAAGLDGALGPAVGSVRSMLSELEPQLGDLATAAADQASAGNGIENPELGPPVLDPGKILCLGLNYRLHADEFGDEPPEVPNVFAKFANSLIGPNDAIKIPTVVSEVDFEGELAVVIGRVCRRISVEDALGYVAGCMVFNDVTARDLQRRTSQWTAGKAIDTFAPCGPALVSLDETGELGELRLRTTLNGNLMQDASISEMIHSVPEAVAFLSRVMTLMPGDIIATGTPHGVGFRREPPIVMQPGDLVQVEIDAIGAIANQVAAENTSPEMEATREPIAPDELERGETR